MMLIVVLAGMDLALQRRIVHGREEVKIMENKACHGSYLGHSF
jgi:hypothetical protein